MIERREFECDLSITHLKCQVLLPYWPNRSLTRCIRPITWGVGQFYPLRLATRAKNLKKNTIQGTPSSISGACSNPAENASTQRFSRIFCTRREPLYVLSDDEFREYRVPWKRAKLKANSCPTRCCLSACHWQPCTGCWTPSYPFSGPGNKRSMVI